MAASLFRAPCMLRGDLVRAIPGIAADADTCLPPLPGNSRNGSADVTPAMPHGRLRYDVHARFGARWRASARVGSRDPVVDSVLIAGHAGTAAAVRGSARESALRRDQRCCALPGPHFADVKRRQHPASAAIRNRPSGVIWIAPWSASPVPVPAPPAANGDPASGVSVPSACRLNAPIVSVPLVLSLNIDVPGHRRETGPGGTGRGGGGGGHGNGRGRGPGSTRSACPGAGRA